MRFTTLTLSIIAAFSLLVAATPTPEVLYTIYHHCPLLTLPRRLIWSASNNTNAGSRTVRPILRLLTSVNASTSRTFPNVIHWTQVLRTVPTESTTSVEVLVPHTMVDRPALPPLVLAAYLLPTMSD